MRIDEQAYWIGRQAAIGEGLQVQSAETGTRAKPCSWTASPKPDSRDHRKCL